MRSNRPGSRSPDAARAGPLQQRLAALSRDVHHAPTARPRDVEGKGRGSKTWHLWVVFDILLLLLTVPLVIAVPPVLDCRRKEDVTRSFVGDSFEKCARAGIAERWTMLDGRLKQMVRHSGQ